MKMFLRHLWPPGIRLQLMLWYTIVFASLLLFTGAIFYMNMDHSLEASLDTALQVRTQQIAGGIGVSNGKVVIQDVTGELPGFEDDPNDQKVSNVDVNYDVLVRLLDTHGRLLHETPAFRSLLVPSISVSQPLQGIPWQGTVSSRSGQEVRLYSRSLSDDGRTFAVIQVGQSLSQYHSVLHGLVGELFVAGGLALLACALGSFWLAGRSLAPILRLIETARRIKAGDLHQRVPIPRAHDEVQFLALTLNEMIESLEQAFIRQRRFVSDASHELRTPVAAIRSKTDLALLHAGTQEEYVTVLQAVNAESERLGHLISDLLALARGDEGQTTFDQEPVRLDRLVEAVTATAEALAAEHQVALEVQRAEPVTVVGDEARLIQAVMNLVENAIFYTNPGGTVTLLVESLHNQARLVVRDTGVGIAPEHLPHIFERFYRADAARTQTTGSSGLGLAIVEWVVQKHNGSITVESQPGQGSCFSVLLPLYQPAQKKLDMQSVH